MSNGMKKFRNEEAMLDYYELKATDHIIDQIREEDEKKRLSEEEEEQDFELFMNLERRQNKRRIGHNRDRSNSLKKNIKNYERLSKRMKPQNLNDSRENDFDGFEDDLE